MAHAGMDHHMDFISLLSLSHLGIPEPESLALSANNKDQTETVSPAVVSQALSESDYTNTAEQHHQQSAPAQPTPASRCLQQNGLGIQILNGTSQSLQGGIIQSTFNGVKRLREQLEYNGIEGAGGGAECCAETTLGLCEDLMIPSKRLCSESSYLNARTLVHQALPPPPPPPPHHHHSPLPSLPDENNVEMNDQTIPITNGVSHSATTAESPLLTTNMEEASNCSGCGGRRRVQICTGFIEEVMFTSKVSNGESCLPQQSSLMQCPRCLSGEPGHLDHMMQNSSTMDTS